ncbi:MAG: efflux RND transporter periplasmic adaptor subunit, partial [Bradyrhizobium sp.]
MSAAGARSATKKTGKMVLAAAALSAAVGLGTAAVIFGPAAATGPEPDRAARLDPRQGSQFVEIAVAKPARASERAFTGIIAARVQSNLGFRVPGKVVERLVDVGQEVYAGQPLMRLDPKDLDLALTAKKKAVAAARAVAAQTRADEARYRQLTLDGWVSRQRYDQAKAAADSAQAQLAAAEAQAGVARNEAGYSLLLADADGTVVATLAEPGQVVAAGQTVVKLAHAGPREASINLPETVRPAIGSAAQASLYGNDAKFPARLRQLSDTADPLTRTYEARYVLSGAGAQAPLGATVTVYLPTGESATATSIPLGALDDEGKEPGVWILDVKKSRVSFHPVQVAEIGKEAAILSGGLTAG